MRQIFEENAGVCFSYKHPGYTVSKADGTSCVRKNMITTMKPSSLFRKICHVIIPNKLCMPMGVTTTVAHFNAKYNNCNKIIKLGLSKGKTVNVHVLHMEIADINGQRTINVVLSNDITAAMNKIHYTTFVEGSHAYLKIIYHYGKNNTKEKELVFPVAAILPENDLCMVTAMFAYDDIHTQDNDKPMFYISDLCDLHPRSVMYNLRLLECNGYAHCDTILHTPSEINGNSGLYSWLHPDKFITDDSIMDIGAENIFNARFILQEIELIPIMYLVYFATYRSHFPLTLWVEGRPLYANNNAQTGEILAKKDMTDEQIFQSIMAVKLANLKKYIPSIRWIMPDYIHTAGDNRRVINIPSEGGAIPYILMDMEQAYRDIRETDHSQPTMFPHIYAGMDKKIYQDIHEMTHGLTKNGNKEYMINLLKAYHQFNPVTDESQNFELSTYSYRIEHTDSNKTISNRFSTPNDYDNFCMTIDFSKCKNVQEIQRTSGILFRCVNMDNSDGQWCGLYLTFNGDIVVNIISSSNMIPLSGEIFNTFQHTESRPVKKINQYIVDPNTRQHVFNEDGTYKTNEVDVPCSLFELVELGYAPMLTVLVADDIVYVSISSSNSSEEENIRYNHFSNYTFNINEYMTTLRNLQTNGNIKFVKDPLVIATPEQYKYSLYEAISVCNFGKINDINPSIDVGELLIKTNVRGMEGKVAGHDNLGNTLHTIKMLTRTHDDGPQMSIRYRRSDANYDNRNGVFISQITVDGKSKTTGGAMNPSMGINMSQTAVMSDAMRQNSIANFPMVAQTAVPGSGMMMGAMAHHQSMAYSSPQAQQMAMAHAQQGQMLMHSTDAMVPLSTEHWSEPTQPDENSIARCKYLEMSCDHVNHHFYTNVKNGVNYRQLDLSGAFAGGFVHSDENKDNDWTMTLSDIQGTGTGISLSRITNIPRTANQGDGIIRTVMSDFTPYNTGLVIEFTNRYTEPTSRAKDDFWLVRPKSDTRGQIGGIKIISTKTGQYAIVSDFINPIVDPNGAVVPEPVSGIVEKVGKDLTLTLVKGGYHGMGTKGNMTICARAVLQGLFSKDAVGIGKNLTSLFMTTSPITTKNDMIPEGQIVPSTLTYNSLGETRMYFNNLTLGRYTKNEVTEGEIHDFLLPMTMNLENRHNESKYAKSSNVRVANYTESLEADHLVYTHNV